MILVNVSLNPAGEWCELQFIALLDFPTHKQRYSDPESGFDDKGLVV